MIVFPKLRLLVAAMAVLAAACVVESEPSHGGGWAGASGPSASGGGSGVSSSGGASAAPVLVDVDTDKTMNAAPGQGVGVFVEYATGGHWHVWWTCDTLVNPQGQFTCDFSVVASVTQGAIALKTTDVPQSGVVTSGTPIQKLSLVTTTGASVNSVSFDTDPGAVLTIDAAVGGAHDGRYFFFVQDGQVNGGFTGTLTDPLMFEGTRP